MNVYDHIDETLKEQKMSRRQLAIKAGIPPSTFQSMMARKKNMPVEVLERVAKALGASDDILRYGYEVDRDYEMVVDVLKDAGFVIEPGTLLTDGYRVYQEPEDGSEADIDILNERPFTEILATVRRILDDAEANKSNYIRRRLAAEFL